jgi:serine-type D-Ala-D-Ala endopeptidase (penicillin-binding protein 7)
MRSRVEVKFHRRWARVVATAVAMTIMAATGFMATVGDAAAATSKTSKAASTRAPARTANPARKNPDVKSKSVLVVDPADSSIVFEREADLVAPIASITKLMTSLVVLDAKLPLDEVIEVTKDDRSKNGKGAFSRLTYGTKLSRGDLMWLALMSSENRAAHALGRNYPGGEAAFVKAMNAKAKALGMTRTHFVDSSGLSSDNVSTPRDLTKLVIAAGRNPTIREYSTSPGHTVKVGRQMLEFHNTNSLVRSDAWDIIVQKTGYISEAGECLVMQAVIEDRPVIIVLLNSFGKYTRVADARRIRQWMEARGTRRVAKATNVAER